MEENGGGRTSLQLQVWDAIYKLKWYAIIFTLVNYGTERNRKQISFKQLLNAIPLPGYRKGNSLYIRTVVRLTALIRRFLSHRKFFKATEVNFGSWLRILSNVILSRSELELFWLVGWRFSPLSGSNVTWIIIKKMIQPCGQGPVPRSGFTLSPPSPTFGSYNIVQDS